MKHRFMATISLIFLCAFFGLIGALGISEISTQYALFAIEVFLMIIAKFDSKDDPP